MLARDVLFRRDSSNDNIKDPAEQRQLCMWRSINAKLLAKIADDDPSYEAARNLVAWCLQGDERPADDTARSSRYAFLASSGSTLARCETRKHIFISHFQAEAAGFTCSAYSARAAPGRRARVARRVRGRPRDAAYGRGRRLDPLLGALIAGGPVPLARVRRRGAFGDWPNEGILLDPEDDARFARITTLAPAVALGR